MSVRVDASGEYLYRTSAFNNASAYTLMLWVYLINWAGGDNTGIFRTTGVQANFNELDDVHYRQATAKVEAQVLVGGGGSQTQGSATIAQNAWRHIAAVRESATSFKVYVDGALDLTNTTNVGARSETTPLLALGLSAGASNRIDGRIAHVKTWTAALTADEVVAEMLVARPMRFANLWGWWPLLTHTDLNDYSGNGRTLTADGAPSTEDGPPVAWGG